MHKHTDPLTNAIDTTKIVTSEDIGPLSKSRQIIKIVGPWLSLALVVGGVAVFGLRHNGSTKALAMNPTPFAVASQADLKGAAPKVFAHYFTPYPISIDNQTSDTDYYARNFLKPSGENGKYAAVGGLLRERPLPRAVDTSSAWALNDMKTEVRRASAAGLDGFTVDVLSLTSANYSRMKLLLQAAQEVDPSFKIILMPDSNGSDVADPAALAASFASLNKTYSSLYKLGDGRLVVSPFYAEKMGAAYWQTWINTMKNQYGITVAFVPCFLNYGNNVAAFTPFSYGFSNWGNRNPANNQNLAATISDAHSRGKIWMQPVSVQDARPNQHIYDESNNTENLRTTWAAAINNKAEWVQIPTWNDYSEGAELAPSTHTGYSPLDLSSYYLSRFKLGVSPTISQDMIYLSHRVHAYSAQPTSGETSLMKVRANGSAPRDAVEALTMLTEARTVTVRVGSSSQTYTAPAGVFTRTFPLQTGNVSATIDYANGDHIDVVSPFPIVSAPYVQDMSYHFVSSGREGIFTTTNVQPPVTTKPDLTITSLNLPSNFVVGQNVVFTALVKNVGSAATPAGTPISASFLVDGKAVASTISSTASLAPGASETLTATDGPAGTSIWVATVGTHSVQAIVDDKNVIKESNETNNTLTASVSVGSSTALSDLSITSLSLPKTIIAGQPLVFEATVKNNGTAATPAGTIIGVSFSVDGKQVAWSDTDKTSLAPGASVSLTANYGPVKINYWTTTGGNHTLEAYVDDINRITESNETNNKLSQAFGAADTTKPIVKITGPTAGSTVKNTSITASATDNVAVVKLELFIDDISYATTNGSSIATSWNTTQLGIRTGIHTITARATDAAGNVGTMSVTVSK